MKKCKRCGTEIPEGLAEYCADCRKEIKRGTIMRETTCERCGKHFIGGIGAKCCPECRIYKHREANKRCYYKGVTRPLGGVGICEECGKEYTVKGWMQKYCPECAENAYKKTDAARRRERYANAPERQITCERCGKVFLRTSVSKTCPECRAELAQEWKKPHKSGVAGVTWAPNFGKWLVHHHNKHIGSFANLEDAIEAKKKAAAE